MNSPPEKGRYIRNSSEYPLYMFSNLKSEMAFLNSLLSSPPIFSPRTLNEIQTALTICNSPFNMSKWNLEENRVLKYMELIKDHLSEDAAAAELRKHFQTIWLQQIIIRYGDYCGVCVDGYRKVVAEMPEWVKKKTTEIWAEFVAEELRYAEWREKSATGEEAGAEPRRPWLTQIFQIAIQTNQSPESIKADLRNYSDRNQAVHASDVSVMIQKGHWFSLGHQIENDIEILTSITDTHEAFQPLKEELLGAMEKVREKFREDIKMAEGIQIPPAQKHNGPVGKKNETKADKDGEEKKKKEKKAKAHVEAQIKAGKLDETRTTRWKELEVAKEKFVEERESLLKHARALKDGLDEDKATIKKLRKKMENQQKEFKENSKALKSYSTEVGQTEQEMTQLALEVWQEDKIEQGIDDVDHFMAFDFDIEFAFQVRDG